MPAASQASLLPDSCLTELDDAVTLYNKGNTRSAAARFESLENSCSHLPQVQHNLGVIAGVRQQWQQASDYFARAIADDARTSMSQSHLQAIHRYKSSKAYRKALGVAGKVPLPELHMQNSGHINTGHETPPDTTQHNVPTVDYELFSWWTAAATNETPAWLEHYTAGYPPQENTDARSVDWDDVARDISFSTQDAVVVLGYQIDDVKKQVLLLMRLQDNRWKIYRERVL